MVEVVQVGTEKMDMKGGVLDTKKLRTMWW